VDEIIKQLQKEVKVQQDNLALYAAKLVEIQAEEKDIKKRINQLEARIVIFKAAIAKLQA
jgi:peptidoglycan hydrolase CwlO-like protein